MSGANIVKVFVFLSIIFELTSADSCEVCVGFLGNLYQALTSGHTELSPDKVEEGLLSACRQARGRESRLCYYLGATQDAATKITAEVARPMSFHLPVGKICQRLQKKDSQICELRYEKQMRDFSKEGLSKLRVAELQYILSSWGEVCRACFEKSDFVSLIQEVAPKYAQENGYRADL